MQREIIGFVVAIVLLTLDCFCCYENEHCPSGETDIIHSYQVQKNDGRYKFGFSDTSGQFRVEERDEEGSVLGSYGYVDSYGEQVRVYYQAGVQGFQILTRDAYQHLRHQMKVKKQRYHAPAFPVPQNTPEAPKMEAQEEERRPYPPIYYWQPPSTTIRWSLPLQQRYPVIVTI